MRTQLQSNQVKQKLTSSSINQRLHLHVRHLRLTLLDSECLVLTISLALTPASHSLFLDLVVPHTCTFLLEMAKGPGIYNSLSYTVCTMGFIVTYLCSGLLGLLQDSEALTNRLASVTLWSHNVRSNDSHQ